MQVIAKQRPGHGRIGCISFAIQFFHSNVSFQAISHKELDSRHCFRLHLPAGEFEPLTPFFYISSIRGKKLGRIENKFADNRRIGKSTGTAATDSFLEDDMGLKSPSLV